MRDLDLEPRRVQALHARGEIELVDVREDGEWEAGRIDGARHVALGDVVHAAETLPRDRPLVFYCRVGGRSTMAAMAFRRAGFDAWSMAGGLVDWDAQGLPLVPEGGTVADH